MCENSKINLEDVLLFLKYSYKTILLFGILGLAVAAIYLAITPKFYEAREIIVMAKVGSPNQVAISGVVIERPEVLISRLSLPTSIAKEAMDACGGDISFEVKSQAPGNIRLSIPRGLDDSVDISVLAHSPALAESCADTYFAIIKNSQDQLVSSYLKAIRDKLNHAGARLAQIQKMHIQSRQDERGFLMSSYLTSGDEVKFLMERIASYESIIDPFNNKPAHRDGAIILSDLPVAPNFRKTMVSGLLGGLLLGILISLMRSVLIQSRRN